MFLIVPVASVWYNMHTNKYLLGLAKLSYNLTASMSIIGNECCLIARIVQLNGTSVKTLRTSYLRRVDMLELLTKIPRKVYVAVSGGPDSMAVVSFLRSNHDVTLLHFNHDTEHGQIAEEFVTQYAETVSLPMICGKITRSRSKDESKEEFWRNERYAFFKNVTERYNIIMAHNLDDAVETWLFTSIHGKPNLIPPRRGQILRPFLLCRKSELENWCERKRVPFIRDPANNDVSYPRVRLRNVIIPEVLKIAGIHKVIAKKYRHLFKRSHNVSV